MTPLDLPPAASAERTRYAPTIARLARIAFWVALPLILWLALAPTGPAVPSTGLGDKAEHSMAFVTLTILALLGYPRLGALTVTAWMVALGAGIEIAQGSMHLGRVADWYDLVADTVAIIIAALIGMGLRHGARRL